MKWDGGMEGWRMEGWALCEVHWPTCPGRPNWEKCKCQLSVDEVARIFGLLLGWRYQQTCSVDAGNGQSIVVWFGQVISYGSLSYMVPTIGSSGIW